MNLVKTLKKAMEHEDNGDTNCDWHAWNSPQRLSKGAGRVGNWKTNRDHSKYSIIKSVSFFLSFFGFYGILIFVSYLMPNPFFTNKQFYFKQFSLAWVLSLIVKTFLFQIIQFSQTVLIQTIQFSISIVFVHTQLNIKKVHSLHVKTVLFQTIPFNVSTVSKSKAVLFQTIQLISMQFKCQNSSISSNSV